ncbi:flagellin [Pseudomonadales bacterium]|nr:flagellin [Pseudomonadales bacterium]
MSLVVNTNVSSLTAQRALAFADSLQGEAMTRLSTGSKINSASDDAAGLAIAQRMTSQVNGLNMAIKNANDGISLTQSVEGALVEVSDMLQRLRELSVQSANDTNTGVDRKAIQEEVDLLVAEISRVSSNTRFNNQPVLDGSFTNKTIQVGTQAGETINITLGSSSADKLGAYSVTGDLVQAKIGFGSGQLVNQTDASDDIIINGDSVSRTIDVAANDSAKDVASKINAVSGATGVTAEAKTYAQFYSMSASDETISVKINNKTTGDFVLSSSNVNDAVDKINAISGTTGVSAKANDANQVILYSATGADILVENEKASTALRLKTVGNDGVQTVAKQSTHANATLAAEFTDGTAHTITNNTTGATADFTTGADGTETAFTYSTKINDALGATVGTKANRVSTNDVTAIATGSYYLKHEPTGDTFKISLGAATTAGWTSAIAAATYEGGEHDGQTRDLSGMLTASTVDSKLQLTGNRVFGDFDVYSDAITSQNIMNISNTLNSIGVEGTGIEVTSARGGAVGTEMGAAAAVIATGDITTTDMMDKLATSAVADGSKGTLSGTTYTFDEDTSISLDLSAAVVGATVTLTGTDRDGRSVSETLDLSAGTVVESTFQYKTLTGMSANSTLAGEGSGATLSVKGNLPSDSFTFSGAREFGDFKIGTAAAPATNVLTAVTAGDKDTQDLELGAAGLSDAGTIQGTMSLNSSKIFTVTQQGTEEAYSGGPQNDNYFTTGSSSLNTVSNVDLRTQNGASAALAIIDGAIEKISSMRADLGAIENRLDHTVSNLMNISENTESARSRIQDADFAAESAKLSKAQVLKQAGVGMLSQANASSQLVLQLLQ